jgi:hypothetical protein
VALSSEIKKLLEELRTAVRVRDLAKESTRLAFSDVGFLDKSKDVSEYDISGEFVEKKKRISTKRVKTMVKKETKRRKK